MPLKLHAAQASCRSSFTTPKFMALKFDVAQAVGECCKPSAALRRAWRRRRRRFFVLIPEKGCNASWQSRQKEPAEDELGRRSSELSGALHSSQRGGPTRPLGSWGINGPRRRFARTSAREIADYGSLGNPVSFSVVQAQGRSPLLARRYKRALADGVRDDEAK
jgi:hypothetical protein